MMNRGFNLLSVFLLFLALPAVGAEAAPANLFIRQHVDQLQVEPGYRVGQDTLIFRSILAQLYLNSDFRPLWQNKNSVEQLLAAIGESTTEGLTPDDFHLATLEGLRAKKQAGIDYPTLAANFDILLSDAFLRLAYAKSFGKVDPNRLDPNWNLPERKIGPDLLARIEQAITDGTIAAMLEPLSPRFPVYEQLKKSLAAYREIQSRGGWAKIEAGQVLKPGMKDPRVPMLRTRLLDDEATSAVAPLVYDEHLVQAVVRFQRRHFLVEDGIVGKGTLGALNQTVEEKIEQIRVNLERARWVLHGLQEKFILVDIAGYSLSYYQGGKVLWRSKVVVGKPYHKTPVFTEEMKYLVINPTWTIPRSIIVNETLPRTKRDPASLQKRNLRIIDRKGHTVDPATIDWQQVSGRSFPYFIRQDPGPHNALGRIKFMFPNKHAIYLHDTPRRDLFSRDQRAFSHGCIRVKDPFTFGELILQEDGQDWDRARIEKVVASEKITTVRLKNPLPVILLYWTVKVSGEDNSLQFKQDIYGRDKALLKALDGPFRLRDSVRQQVRVTDE